MKAAIVVLPHTSADDAREMLACAGHTKAGHIEAWALGDGANVAKALPVAAVVAVQAQQAAVPDPYVPLFDMLINERDVDVVLFDGGRWGHQLAVRTGYRTKGAVWTKVTALQALDGAICVTKRIYGYHIDGHFTAGSLPLVISVERGAFKADATAGEPDSVVQKQWQPEPADWISGYEHTAAVPQERLDTYDLLLVGGRGMGRKENMGRLAALGRALGAGVGATRPAVLNGWLDHDKMVGLSGVTAAPKVCVAFGVSGCPPFVMGVEKAGTLIGVNTDANAMIFDHCDIGIVADADAFCRQLAAEIDTHE